MVEWNIPLTEPKVAETFSVAGRFRLIQVLDLWIQQTPDPRNSKSFPLKTGFFYAQVPFKTGSTVYYM
jgi:hypothetical protein